MVCLAWYFQDNLLYVPSLPQMPKDVMMTPFQFGWKGELSQYEQIWIIEPVDEVKLQAWFFKSDVDPVLARKQPTLLFLHSNAGNLSHRIPNIRDLVERCHYNVLILSYRGYGRSEGIPTEDGLKRDAAATLKYLASGNIASVDPRSIIIYSRSLGAAVGIWLASNFPEWLAGIVVENAFTSVPAMVDVVLPALKYVKFLSRNTWDNLTEVKRVVIPMLFMSSQKDELVPPQMMTQIHEAAINAPINRIVKFELAQHMNCFQQPGYYEAIQKFVTEALRYTHSLRENAK